MSSMIKKKGALSFKPKAPQIRRPPGAVSTPSSTRPSVERQGQTPVPNGKPADPTPLLGLSTNPPVENTNLNPPKETPQSDITTEQRSHIALTFTEGDATAGKPALKRKANTEDEATQAYPAKRKLARNIPFSGSTELEGTGGTVTAERSAQLESDLVASVPNTTTTNSSQVQSLDSETPVTTQSTPGHDREDGSEPRRTNIESVDQNRVTTETPVTDSEAVSLNEPARRDPTSLVSKDPASSIYPDPTIAGGIDLSAIGAGEVSQVANVIPMEPLNPDGTSAAAEGEAVAGQDKRKRPARKRRIAQGEDNSDVRATIEIQLNKPRRTGRKPSEKKKEPRAKKRRAVTPEGAELDKIEPSVIKMAELCQDLRIGQKFSKHDEIKKRDMQRKARAKLAMLNPELASPEAETNRRGSEANGEAEDTEVRIEPSAGPRMRVIDGQIVLDDSTLVLDRQKRAAEEGLTLEEVEENDFTRVVTSATYMKREKAQTWDAAAEEMFYKGLRMFGTDFQTISKMFPHRNRRQIKLKFNREEKVNPDKITKALVGERVTIDLEEYQSLTGLQYEEVADIEAERARIDKEHEAEEQARLAELAEATRQKKAAIHANAGGKENNPGADNEDGKASAASKSKKKSAKSKKKNLNSVSGGGEEVEVLGTIA